MADISILSLETELLFGVTQPCTRPIAGLRSVLSWPASRFARRLTQNPPVWRTKDRAKRWIDRAPDFLEIKSSERASEPVSPSVNQARNPLCKPVLSHSRPRSLARASAHGGLHFLPLIHQRMTPNRPLLPSIQRTTFRPGKGGSTAPPPPLRVTVQIVTPPTSRRISSDGRPAFKCSWRKRFWSRDHDGNGHLSQSVREKRTSSGGTR